jgi:hypothetical protein
MARGIVPAINKFAADLRDRRRFRAMGSLCRQQAAYNPAQSWKLLAEAEYWELCVPKTLSELMT